MALTPKRIGAIRAGPAWTTHRDGIVPGLVLRVSPLGAKSFSLVYRINGRQRRYTLGPVDLHQEPLAQIRERARGLLARVRLGEDPAAKHELPDNLTLAELCEKFLKARLPNLAPQTGYEYERMIESPKAGIKRSTIGETPAARLVRGDVRAYLEAIAEKAPSQSNRIFQLLRAAIRWGVREGYLERNPIDAMQQPRKERSRERWLSDDEWPWLWKACGKLEHDERQKLPAQHRADPSPAVGAAVRMLLLLGQRSSETIEMRWADLDTARPDRALWTMPGKYRKGGRPHAVPLPPLALRIIEGLRPLTGGKERVFEDVSSDNMIRWWRPIFERTVELAKQGKVDLGPFVKHDLRRTCAVGIARLGATSETVSRLLGHAMIQGTVPVTAVYDRFSHIDTVRTALSAWSAHVETITTGRARKGRVTAFTRRA
jgi:integrase